MNVHPLPGGYYAATRQVATGVGPTVWAGALLGADKLPARERLDHGQHRYPVTLGADEPALLAKLADRAARLPQVGGTTGPVTEPPQPMQT